MPVGFEYYDASGNLIATTDTQIFKILGVISVDSAVNPSGSVSNSNLAFGTDFEGWFMPFTNARGSPDVTVNASGVSWSNSTPGVAWQGLIYYGFW